MLSLPHLVILFLIALMVFGPEKMPELARKLGKAMAEFRRISFDVRRVVEDEMREMERAAREADLQKREAELAAKEKAAQVSISNVPPTGETGPVEGTIPATPPSGAKSEPQAVAASSAEAAPETPPDANSSPS